MFEMSDTNQERVHPSFKHWPLVHFKQFQEFSIQETGHPGIYWLTVKILMDRCDQLEKLVYHMDNELSDLKGQEDLPLAEEDKASSESKPVTLGKHE